MAEFPALPLFTDAYLADTLDLTAEEHGVYLLLLIMAWRRPECSIPDDMGELKRKLGPAIQGGHGNRFNRLVPPILDRFFTRNPQGEYVQKRLEKEREFLRKLSRKQSEIAKKRWAGTKEINNLADARAMPRGNAPTPTPSIRESEYVEPLQLEPREHTPLNLTPRAGARGRGKSPSINPAEFEKFYSVFPRKVGRPKAEAAYARARLTASAAEILEGAEKYAAARAGQNSQYTAHPSTWLNRQGWRDEIVPPDQPDERNRSLFGAIAEARASRARANRGSAGAVIDSLPAPPHEPPGVAGGARRLSGGSRAPNAGRTRRGDEILPPFDGDALPVTGPIARSLPPSESGEPVSITLRGE